MTYILSYSSISSTKKQILSDFSGSSKFKIINGEMIKKNINKISNEQQENISKRKTGNDAQYQTEECNKSEYLLNKSKVKKKCYALSRLEKSKKFLVFYTITFPAGLSDFICYELFNKWLTRCRRDAGLKTYLWVAERQKNETIHFHLLTNDFMPINEVNGFMSTSLSNNKKKGLESLKDVDTAIYNGVDVKKIGKKRNSIVSYITKYVTKNNIKFFRLPWHCSRDISRLFTSVNFEDEESEKFFLRLPNKKEKYKFHYSDYLIVAGFKFNPDEELFIDLDDLNEYIYNLPK